MKDFFRPKTFKILFYIIFISILLSTIISFYEFQKDINYAQADSNDGVTGYAWNSNFGWISFNCTNDTPECGSSDYGVDIDPDTGDFSGYAWSSNAGWIDFAPLGPYPETPDYSAQYSSVDNKVTGWAKIIAWGDDGWIKMNGSWADGVSIDPATGDFLGYAWNANDDGSGMGLISFNCLNTDSCAISDYKVSADNPPTISSFSAPNWSYDSACIYPAKNAILRWVFSDPDAGSSQSAYQVIFDDDSDPADPIIDTEKVYGSANQYIVTSANLDYDTAYYYWVKVWDEYDLPSVDFVQYNAVTDTDNDDGNNLTFTTYSHEFPDVDFSWSPNWPSKDEEVSFGDLSELYLSGAPSTSIECDDSNCIFAWSVSNGIIDDSATSTPIITFNTSGNQTVTLEVTNNDGTGYTCSKTVDVSVKGSLPGWEEVIPE